MQRPSRNTGLATEADHAACAALLRTGSKTFQAASFALPAHTRRAATALYAFCRLADDAVDLRDDGAAELALLRQRLELAYAGTPQPIAADRALAEVVHEFSIPRDLPEALLEGFAWDLDGRRYQTLSDLTAYAARVAGTVGAMMALLMDAHEPAVLARACELGVAMQLTNIARDVGEDARRGRLYLPIDWLLAQGIDPDAFLASPVYSPALGNVIERLLRHADMLYLRAGEGIGQLPVGCRPAMHAARLLYCEIGNEVRRRGLDSVTGRAVVPWSRKSRVLGSAMLAAARGTGMRAVPMLEETRFLVEAAAAAAEYARVVQPTLGDTQIDIRTDGRVAWLVDLFTRLEQRERYGAERQGNEPSDGGPLVQPA